MRDLFAHPAHQEKDLGFPIPDSPHACSVCLPTWASVVGYEEGRDKVMRRLRAGYPRFVRHPLVARATQLAAVELAGDGDEVFLFPTRQSAQRGQRWIERRGEVAARSAGFQGLQALIVPKRGAQAAVDYQRFTGELISSRMAADLVEGTLRSGSKRHLLQRRLATLYRTQAPNVSVFGNGMAAVTAVLRSLPGLAAGRKTLQVEFPYVDSLKVQELIGNGAVFLGESEGESFDEALRRIRRGEFAAVFTEVPSNPLLRCVDLPALAKACREGGVPLVVDDSSVGPANVDVLGWADVVTCSLTKWLSGEGDVMGGAAVVRPDSEFAGEIGSALRQESEESAPIYIGDVEVLLSNLKGYSRRVATPNATALALVDLLSQHPGVEQVWHPSRTTRARYESVMAAGGGFGGLLSFTLRTAKKAAKVFDALELTKGPSFGTRFTLVCPYVMLAHYRELDWASACGVPSHLLRVSCGEEPVERLAERFESALRFA